MQGVQKAIAIFYEVNSGRAVGRVMGINKSTVCNWIKKLDKKACSQEQVTEKPQTVDVIEIDELLPTPRRKNRTYVDNIGDEKTATNRSF